jgi:hypothetical protein
VSIPVSIVKALNWEDKDDINMILETKNNMKGIFLFKKES